MSSTVIICSTGGSSSGSGSTRSRAIAYFTVVFSVNLRINSLAGAAFIALHARKSPGRPNMFQPTTFALQEVVLTCRMKNAPIRRNISVGAVSLPLMKNPT